MASKTVTRSIITKARLGVNYNSCFDQTPNDISLTIIFDILSFLEYNIESDKASSSIINCDLESDWKVVVRWKVSFRYLTYCFDPNRWKLSLIDGVDVSHFILFGEKSRSFHQKKENKKACCHSLRSDVFKNFYKTGNYYTILGV